MAVVESASGLLSTLTNALESAASAFPENGENFLPPTDGISLLDVKNDLLLSYIQNLVFIVIMKLRNDGSTPDMTTDVIKKLVELRVYLERGVRPLEGKLKYQIDKVVRAAEEADRRASQKPSAVVSDPTKKSRKSKPHDEYGAVSRGEASVSGSEDSDDEEEEEERQGSDGQVEASVGPRPAALLRNTADKSRTDGATKSRTTGSGTGASAGTGSGAYKPPRITPTAMPEPSMSRNRDEPARKRRSQLLDEYIDEEISTAPRSQPSIGSNNTIVQHGRGAMSTRDREKERERQDYEERNFVRLPAESKAERKKARQRGEHNRRDMFGGEDWTGLGGLGDRIHRSVAGRARAEGGNLLERREKRRRDTQDGPRGDGSAGDGGGGGGGGGIGESFEKRRKIMQQRAEKKARRTG